MKGPRFKLPVFVSLIAILTAVVGPTICGPHCMAKMKREAPAKRCCCEGRESASTPQPPPLIPHESCPLCKLGLIKFLQAQPREPFEATAAYTLIPLQFILGAHHYDFDIAISLIRNHSPPLLFSSMSSLILLLSTLRI